MRYVNIANSPKHPSRIAWMMPNIVTGLALCAGLLSIRFSIEGHFDFALVAIIASAILDGLDGRLARMLGTTSRFGEEFDSLADFLSFGLAPIILMFFWAGEAMTASVSLCLMAFAVASACRLARFNADAGTVKAEWRKAYFTGMPTPSAAVAVLLPVSLFEPTPETMPWLGFYTLIISFLMVSTVPTFSGKRWHLRRSPLMAASLISVALGLLAVVATCPRASLVTFTVVYLSSLPISWMSFQHERKTHRPDMEG